MYDLNHGTHLIECLVCLFMSRINWHIFSDVYLKQSIYQLKYACILKYFLRHENQFLRQEIQTNKKTVWYCPSKFDSDMLNFSRDKTQSDVIEK